jgi:cysteine-rich repeat protein
VWSTTEWNSKSDTSNYGDSLVFSAPWDNILSTCVWWWYCNKSWTSMASPVVAWSVAYLMWLWASAEQAIQELVNTAVSINTSVNMWAGRIDLCAATASFLWVSSSACNEVYPVCGNGVIEGNESCNDGNSSNWDWCTSECMIENWWVCESDLGCVSWNCEEVIVELCVSWDYGEKIACEWFSTQVSCLWFKQNVWTNGELLSVCQWESQAVMMCMPTCGNSIVEEWEYCDDGNSNEWDGCSSICTETCIYWEKPMNWIIVNWGKWGEVLPVNKVTCRCGDGIINGWEECDWSDLKKWIHCTAECKIQKVDEWPQLPIPWEGRGER